MDRYIDDTAKLYNCQVVRSCVEKYSSVGDFSKVIDSRLGQHVRIDRYNHIDSCQLGSYSYTGKNTIALHSSIGSFTSISWNVTLGGANHDYRRGTQHSLLYDPALGFVKKPVYNRYDSTLSIGSDVWIGAGAVVLRGVKIGDGAVIGANCVVTKDVPPYAIYAGNPGKVIKYRYCKEKIEEMLQIKWWAWPEEKIKNNVDWLSSVINEGEQ